MIKAFFSVKALKELYSDLSEKYEYLYFHKGEKDMTYKDKMVFEACSFGLPLLDDYFDNNLSSIVNYLRMESLIESCALMSLGEEEDFRKVNLPLFDAQYASIYYRTYFYFTPDFVNLHDLKNEEMMAKKEFADAILRDEVHSYGLSADAVSSEKMPILLGRSVSESIRAYLGYIFQGIYLRSGEMIHLIDYRDLDDKYSISFFNDVSRMLSKIDSEYSIPEKPKKRNKALTRDDIASIKNVFEAEQMALKAFTTKLDSRFKKSFLSSALTEYGKVEKSVETLLLKGHYSDLNTVYKIVIEWLANVNSIAGESSSLINFNYGSEISKLGQEERELKFVSMSRNLITPNLLWQKSSLRQIVYNYIDSTHPSMKPYFGLTKADYLKMKYYEAQASTHGNGFLWYAPIRYFACDKDLIVLMDDLFKEMIEKVRLTLKDVVDLTVEAEGLSDCLGKKDAYLLK